MAHAPVTLLWEVAADEDMFRLVQSGEVIALPEEAHSVHLELRGLEPGRAYFYRFR